EAASESGQHGVGLVAFAIKQPIHAPLQPLADWLEKDGDDSGGNQRDKKVAAGLQLRAQRADNEHIQSDDSGGKRAVDQGAVDDDVDGIEVVAQDGDGG